MRFFRATVCVVALLLLRSPLPAPPAVPAVFPAPRTPAVAYSGVSVLDAVPPTGFTSDLSVLDDISRAGEVSWGARASVAGLSMSEAGWRWPLTGGRPEVVRGFEPPPQPWLPGHRGVDLGAAPGAVVVAAGSGVVRFAGMVVDRPVVSIAHADGLITTYEPVTPLVVVGEMVMAGQPIGVLVAGHAGCAGACLHWGLRHGSSYLDPLALLGRVRVRLLPLDGLVR